MCVCHLLRRRRCAYERQPKSFTRHQSRASKWKDTDRKNKNKAPASATAQWYTRCWTQRQNNNNNASNQALSVRARFFRLPAPSSFLSYPCCYTLFAFNWICLCGYIPFYTSFKLNNEISSFYSCASVLSFHFTSFLSVHCCWWMCMCTVCIAHSKRLVVRTHHTHTHTVTTSRRQNEATKKMHLL